MDFIIIMIMMVLHFSLSPPQWGTADAEIKNPPSGSQGLSKVPSF